MRRLQRSAWERIRRGKVLLFCCLLGGAKCFSAYGGEGAGAYHGGRLPTACFSSVLCSFHKLSFHSHSLILLTSFLVPLLILIHKIFGLIIFCSQNNTGYSRNNFIVAGVRHLINLSCFYWLKMAWISVVKWLLKLIFPKCRTQVRLIIPTVSYWYVPTAR